MTLYITLSKRVLLHIYLLFYVWAGEKATICLYNIMHGTIQALSILETLKHRAITQHPCELCPNLRTTMQPLYVCFINDSEISKLSVYLL